MKEKYNGTAKSHTERYLDCVPTTFAGYDSFLGESLNVYLYRARLSGMSDLDIAQYVCDSLSRKGMADLVVIAP